MKQSIFLYLFILISLSTYSINFEEILSNKHKNINKNFKHAVTNKLENWRRLGDAITTVCKTLYFAQTYNIPFYYQQFPYSDLFNLHNQALLTEELKKQFS